MQNFNEAGLKNPAFLKISSQFLGYYIGMKKLMFVYNPVSGKMDVSRNLSEIVEVFSKDYLVEIHATGRKGDGYKYIMDNLDESYDCLVCAGGDGTLSEAVSAVIDKGIDMPLGYIPSGSTNDFARSIGIPDKMKEAAQAIVSGECQRFDAGKFNDSYFIYVAAFGLFTEVSYKTDQDLKNVLGHAAYIVSGIRDLDLNKSYAMKAINGEDVYEGNFIFGMVTNSLSIGGIKNITGRDTKLDDGLFEVTLVKQVNNIDDLNDIVSYFILGDRECKAVIHFTAPKLEIICEQGVDWTLDGEYGGNIEEAVIENLHNKVCFRK